MENKNRQPRTAELHLTNPVHLVVITLKLESWTALSSRAPGTPMSSLSTSEALPVLGRRDRKPELAVAGWKDRVYD